MATSTGLPGFNSPAVGFERPFAMLEACHERVERTLTLLSRLRSYLHDQAVDEPARQAARDVLRYFDIAAPLHHEDEELHVFPRLLQRGAPSVVALVQRLQQDHVQMAADWAAARGALQALADGSAERLSAQEEALLEQFAQRYGQHIQAEEGTAYPSAQALLSEGDLHAMGLEMAGRRRSTP